MLRTIRETQPEVQSVRERLLDEAASAEAADEEAGGVKKQKPKASSTLLGFYRIVREVRFVRPQLYLGCLFLIGGSVSKNALPYLSGALLDTVAAGLSVKSDPLELNHQRHLLDVVCLQLAGAAVVTGVLSGVRAYCFNGASEKVVAAVRSKLFRSLLRQELGFYDANTSGSLISRISADTEALKDAGTTNFSILFRSLVDLVVSLTLMLITSWRLTLLSLAITPVAALVVASTGRRLMKLSKEARQAAADGSSAAADCIGAMRTVKAFGREDDEGKVFDATVATTLRLGLTAARAGSLFTAFAITILGGVVALVFWYGGRQVLLDRMTVGSLQSFLLYALGIGGAFAGIAGTIVSTFTAIGSRPRRSGLSIACGLN
jgi:ABC-type multidrug transport system fused ATPase/permease subunit